MIKKITVFFLVFALFMHISVYAETLDCSTLENETVFFSGELYLPVCETLSACGFALSWDKNSFAYRAESGDRIAVIPLNSYSLYINNEEMVLNNPTAFRNNVLYMPLSAAKEICQGWNFDVPAKNINFSIGDKYRFDSAERYKDWYVCDDKFIFKQYYISQSGALEYADIVRSISDSLPDVRIFDMLVPEGSEIYAPKSLQCGQVEAFNTAAIALPQSVTVVNICSGLYERAAEKIYFNTDHHWTQRGAYYAYCEFLKVAGGSIDSIASFESRDFFRYKGSYINEGYDRENYEIMERFMPKGENIGYVYKDGDFLGEKKQIQIINPDDDTYACFIGGDNALTELCGNPESERTLCIVKESFGNALATWAVNNYKTVYVVDVRKFEDTLSRLYDKVGFDDLLIESYAESVGSRDLRAALKKLAG